MSNDRIKKFENQTNQAVWDAYQENRIIETVLKLKEKYQKRNQIKSDAELNENALTSIIQYKPACIALEQMTAGKDFSDVTAAELEKFIQSNLVRNTGHIRGFYITAINLGLVKPSKDLICVLLPIEYRTMAEILITERG